MLLLSKRSMLGIAAVVDIALHARAGPVAAKALANRHNLPPRHLETLLQALVRSNILKGVRGPRGGYELARERRRVTAGDVVRSAMSAEPEDPAQPNPSSKLMEYIVEPALVAAGNRFLTSLDAVTIDDLCREAELKGVFRAENASDVDFTI
jgi:Rrf2 family iron-sulfur cluster assembly transcriptional regulator